MHQPTAGQVAIAVVTIPAWARLADSYWGVYRVIDVDGAARVAASLSPLVPAIVPAIALVVLARRAQTAARRAAAAGAAWGLAVTSLTALDGTLKAVAAAGGLPADHVTVFLAPVLGRASSDALRWIAFGVFASVALLRDDLLGLGVAARRRAARALVALAVLARASSCSGSRRARRATTRG